MSDDKFDASLELLRRLDPRSIEQNLTSICSLLSSNNEDTEIVEELLSSIDVPLKVSKCKESGKEYLCCDYNRDGDSYRSPWSNQYYPPPEDDDDEEVSPPYPSELLRQLEFKANDAFDIYRDLYYEGAGVSSVYFWDTSDDDDEGEGSESTLEKGFAGVILFKKETNDKTGKWDSIHVLEVLPEGKNKVLYKLTTSVILDLQNKETNSLSLSGNLTRQLEQSQLLDLNNGVNLETNHLINIGTMVEKAEYNIRNVLQEVYFDKLKDIMLKDLRTVDGDADKAVNAQQSDIIKGLEAL
ncbi:CAP2 [Candida oxycetoniae]|uniref:F-actin-capping protein subunit beta n=1 Tax=Candida oxycetoniae TaxID=497107 RepID=A0AAI9WWH2_9ASCO|nr:CAP2 [Candida oxycetoniae]KAI3402739.1 CAP2 [Candida oxycetoniae]